MGRTARFESQGRSVLFLLPSEEAFIEKLQVSRVPVKVISPKQGKMISVQQQLQSLLASDASIKHLAQKAFSSYVRSVLLMKDKAVFKACEQPHEEFALSLGLVIVPTLPNLKDSTDQEGNPLKKQKNQSALQRLKDKIKAKKEQKKSMSCGAAAANEEEDTEDDEEKAGRKIGRWERRQRRLARLASTGTKSVGTVEREDDFLHPVTSSTTEATAETAATKPAGRLGRRLKLRRDGASLSQGQHIYFAGKKGHASSEFAAMAEELGGDDDGTNVHRGHAETRQAFLERVSKDLAQRDAGDAMTSRARVQDMHRKKKKKDRQERRASAGQDSDVDAGVTLGAPSSPSPEASCHPDSSEEEPVAPPPKRRRESKKLTSSIPDGETAFRTSVAGTSSGSVDGGDDLGKLERDALRKLSSSGLFG